MEGYGPLYSLEDIAIYIDLIIMIKFLPTPEIHLPRCARVVPTFSLVWSDLGAVRLRALRIKLKVWLYLARSSDDMVFPCSGYLPTRG